MDDTYSRLACAAGCGEGCVHKACKACGKTFEVKRDRNIFCSAECRNADRARPLCQCKQCGTPYKPKYADRTTFCSRTCAFAHKHANATGKAGKLQCSSVYFAQCTVCGQSFTGRQANQTRCGKACDMEHARRDSLKRNESRHRQDAKVVQCEECQHSFCPLYGSSNASLCSPCAAARKKAAAKASKLMREMRTRASAVERVDPIKVFERDGWLCRMCGVPTPRAKRGAYDDDAPELDHIKPISKGGAHTYANTQCACRKCNGQKGDQEGWRPRAPAPVASSRLPA